MTELEKAREALLEDFQSAFAAAGVDDSAEHKSGMSDAEWIAEVIVDGIIEIIEIIDAKLKGGDQHSPLAERLPDKAEDIATPAASPAPAAGRPTDEQIKRGVAAIRAEFPDAICEPYEHWPAIKLKPGEKPVELEDLAYCVLKAAMTPEPPADQAPSAPSPLTVEPACPYCGGTGRFQGKFSGPDWPKCPRCYGLGKAADVGPRNAVEAAAVPAAGGGAERLAKAAEYLEYMDVGTADRHAANVREAATLLIRQANLIRTLVEALRVAKSAIGSFVGPDDYLGQTYIREITSALDAARAMGFGKEGE